MSEQASETPELMALKKAVRDAVESGGNMQAKMRELTMSALSSGHLDLEHMRQITRTVIEGIGEAAESSSQAAGIIQQSLAGVEDALSQAGEASMLAFREAAGRAGEFTRQDLGQALDELATLQHVYTDALSDVLADVTHAGADTLIAIFEDMHAHARNSGSAFAGRIADGVDDLRRLLPAGPAGAGMADAADTMARLASGILRGIQQGLAGQSAAESVRTDNSPPDKAEPVQASAENIASDDPSR